jgi:hypothetical protein
LAFEDEKMTVKFRMKVSHGFKERTMNPNTWETFQALVFEFDIENGSGKLYSMRKNWDKVQAFKRPGRLTSPWINCQLGGISLHSIGSMRHNKMISLKLIFLSLIKYRDIVFYQKS